MPDKEAALSHSDAGERSKIPHWSDDLKYRLYETLKFYANVTSYQGERTGGVLKGCPRGPKPDARELSTHARMMLRQIDRLDPNPDVANKDRWGADAGEPAQPPADALTDLWKTVVSEANAISGGHGIGDLTAAILRYASAVAQQKG